MKKSRPPQPSAAGDGGPARRTPAARIWLLTAEPSVQGRIEALLVREGMAYQASRDPQSLLSAMTEQNRPAVILLDVDNDLDQGVETIGLLKKMLRKPAIVVLTSNMTHAFGVKVISQGIRYYFAYDFCEKEFLEVMRSLLGQADPRDADGSTQ